MGTVYREIKITWWNDSGVTWITTKSMTKEQAWDNARFFGCRRPRWFEFWIRRPIMEVTL
jgi:hypothetical protein